MTGGEQRAAQHDDWASQATQLVERFVGAVRDRSVRPVLFAVRALVVGSLVSLIVAFILVVVAIGVVRLLTADAFGGRVWASDLVIGGIFSAAGALLVKLGGIRRSEDADRRSARG